MSWLQKGTLRKQWTCRKGVPGNGWRRWCGADWVALSFVQRPEDVAELRTLVQGKAGIVAKLEKPAAIAALDASVAETDAVMVARGDLGVEMPPEAVPAIQKRIVDACRRAGKPVIVATQMLESMVHAPVPTRAEASDVATAIYEGVDAVMLSAESASGRYPVEAVRMMSRIVSHTEDDPHYRAAIDASRSNPSSNPPDAIGFAMRHVTELLRAAATVPYTSSGYSALRMARERPSAPIIGMTPRLAATASSMYASRATRASTRASLTKLSQRIWNVQRRWQLPSRGRTASFSSPTSGKKAPMRSSRQQRQFRPRKLQASAI